MSDLTVFAFDSAAVRVIQVEGEPWFVGKDVAEILGYTNPQKAVRDHCKKPRAVGGERIVHPHRLDPQTVIINEPDMLRLIMSSRLPAAERFERWVFEEVLPSIRKTGRYTMPAQAPQEPHLGRAMRSQINRKAYELACEMQADLRQWLTQIALQPLQPGENQEFPHNSRAWRITRAQVEDAKSWMGSEGRVKGLS